MRVAFLNPQGNFDPADSYLAQHPDFGGQLVYVKELALAMGELGHQADIITRQIQDPDWPEFSSPQDAYPQEPSVRILRFPAGPERFLRKELLWPYLGPDWVPNIIRFYDQEGEYPDFFTAHYGDGGISAALLKKGTGIPFSFTAHSLGAHKMDNLGVDRENFPTLNSQYSFTTRLIAERTAMNHSLVNITSTTQERHKQYGHAAYHGAVDPADEHRFAVIPPGVNLATFDKGQTAKDEAETVRYLREMLARDILDDRLELPCIVASSRLDSKKNHLGLLKAYGSNPVLQNKSNLVMLTSGLSNPLQEYPEASATEKAVLDPLLEYINEQELRGKIAMFSLEGHAQLGTAYRYFGQQRSIFILPALHEPFGLAPLEAMAAGMPAVVTKFGGPSESMRDGKQEYGVLIDPFDPEQISRNLLALLADAKMWEKYARAGYSRVVSKYNWKKTAAAYLETLRQHQAQKKTRDTLQIHPYYSDPVLENVIKIADLQGMYREMKVKLDWFRS